MATTGQSITKANMSATTTDTCVYDHDSGGNNGVYYYYVCSPCWRVRMRLVKNYGSWSRTNRVYADYWNGSSWVRAMSKEVTFNQFNSYDETYYLYHNWNGASTSGDVADADLWRIVFDPDELYHRYLYITTGGIGAMNADVYNGKKDANGNVIYKGWKGKPIYSNGNLSNVIYRNGDNQDDAGARSYFKNSNNRGTPIYATYDTHLIYTDYYR